VFANGWSLLHPLPWRPA